MGTVEVALDAIRCAFPRVARATLNAEVVSACEKVQSLRGILCQRSTGCVFGDVFERLSGVGDRPRGGQPTHGQISNALVANSSPCAQHGGSCAVPRADINVSGSSCRLWSRANKSKHKSMEHEDAQSFLAWARIIRHDKPPIVIHENVVGFDGGVLSEELGGFFDFCRLEVSAADAGFGFIRRDRVYHVLSLRGVARMRDLPSIYEALAAGLANNASSWPTWVWRAESDELECELALAWMSKRRRGGRNSLEEETWQNALTEPQQGYLAILSKQWQRKHGVAPDSSQRCVFDLGDSPLYKAPGDGAMLPTLRKRSTPWWSPQRGRWMTPREKAACMGFPVYPDLARAARVAVDEITGRDSTAASIGNAMHVASVGLVILAALAAVEWPRR